ncbi:MAG: response regulator [Bryobacterales bacterium]|nr:response regulator [Bryobacterales bacterium]
MFWLWMILLAAVAAVLIHKWSAFRNHSEGSEVELNHARTRASLLFQHAPIAYLEVDGNGIIMRVNQRECSMRLLAAKEMIGRPCWNLASPEEREKLKEEIQRKLAGQAPLLPVRRRCVRANGESITVEVHESLLEKPDGTVYGMLLASFDITDRQKDQEEVFRTTTELKALFQALPDMLLRLDPNDVVLDARAGQPAEALAGCESLLRKRFQEALPPQEGLKVEQALQRVRRTHAMVMVELTVPGVSGGAEIYEARFCPNYRNETIVVIRRITERRQSEERLEAYAQELEQKNEELATALANAREATEMKSRFLANMSHEIRTPMNGILGMTEFLLGTSLGSEQREYATAVKQSADALLTLINDILDISKIEAGKLRLEMIPFDLAMTVEEVQAMCAIRARAKGIEFSCSTSEDIPSYVIGDPGRLRQVLNNLLSNAIKFTDRGKVSVFTELIGERGQTVTLRFMVQDTGIGIAPEYRDRLFQSFVQGDNSTTRKYGGTGLGLAISRQLVEMMGGEIGFNSEPGRGSTFFFTVVFERAPVVLPFEDDATPEARQGLYLNGVPVLLLAGSDSSSVHLRQFFESWRCPYLHVQHPGEMNDAMHKAAAKGSDIKVALVDLDTPGVNPGAVAGALKYDLALRDTPLIAITSTPLRGDGLQLREAGYAGYLNKPIRATQLYETMVELIRKKENAATTPVPAQLVTRHTLAEKEKRTRGGEPLVLLAEDNLINQRIALRLLQKLGVQADVVNNGREALTALDRTAYDLVLMDCQMPEMDGFEATSEIRKREGTSKHTLICALTANAMVGDREKCLSAGMDDYISKPVGLSDLQGALQRLLYKDTEAPQTRDSQVVA